MKRLVSVMMIIGVGVLLGACDKKSDAGGEGAGAGGGASANTGVKECDEYITKYEGCFQKMDAVTKAAAEPAFKAQRDAFKQAAGTPAGKTALVSQCKTLLDGLANNPACK
jgi:hypothetical protein